MGESDNVEELIREAAFRCGFLDARPASAEPFDLWRERLDAMAFGRTFSLEHRPAAIAGWPEAETTIFCAIFSVPAFDDWPNGFGEVSNSFFRYAQMRPAIAAWGSAVQAMGYEAIVDPPLPARAAAVRAGLGIPGLFGPLITPQYGSFVCIVLLLVHMRPPKGTPGSENDISAGCERCGRCVRACPAQAISNRGLDPLRCLRNEMYAPQTIPERDFPLMGRRIIGCETCQRVCPHNRSLTRVLPTPQQLTPFSLEMLLCAPDFVSMRNQIESCYIDPIGIQMQAILAAANTERRDLIPLLEPFLSHKVDALRRSARWALNKLQRGGNRNEGCYAG